MQSALLGVAWSSMVADLVASLRTMDWWSAIVLLVAANIALFVGSIAAGEILIRTTRSSPRLGDKPPPVTRADIGWAGACLVVNTMVSVAGLALYRAGAIEVVLAFSWWRPIVDVVVLTLAMDAAMYAGHRIAHHRLLFPPVHQLHHRHEYPRPLTLFVVHPLEVIGFGALWLTVISLYTATWTGITVFLAINITWGTLGHLGIEPFPNAHRHAWSRWIATSTFHAGHHHHPDHNYGFYTLIWDRLLGTAITPTTSSGAPPQTTTTASKQ